MLQQFQSINQNLLIYLNGFALNPTIKNIVIIFADFPIFFLPAFLVGYWFYYSKNKDIQRKEGLLYIFYSTIISVVLNMIIQHFIYIERPLTFLGAKAHFILSHIPDASFPSDHASVGFAFVTAIYLFGYRKISYYFLPVVILMLLSRVIAGVHWPLDIIAGMILGIISAYMIYIFKDLIFFKKLNSTIIKTVSVIKL